MANTRNIALNVLLKIENEGAYSNIAFHSNSSAIRLKAVHGETLILQVLMSFVTVQKIIRIPKVQVQQLSV